MKGNIQVSIPTEVSPQQTKTALSHIHSQLKRESDKTPPKIYIPLYKEVSEGTYQYLWFTKHDRPSEQFVNKKITEGWKVTTDM